MRIVRWKAAVCLALFTIFFPPQGSAQTRSISWTGTGQWVGWSQALSLAKMSKKPILVLVYNDSCRHCYKVPRLFRSTVMRRITSHFIMVRHNADRKAAWYKKVKPFLGMYYPKFLFFNNKGAFLKKINTGHKTLPYAYNYERPKRLMKDMMNVACRSGARGACKSKKKTEKGWKKQEQRIKRKAALDKKKTQAQRRRAREKRRAPNLTPALYKQYKRYCYRKRSKTHCWELILWHLNKDTQYEEFRAARVARFACYRLRWTRGCLEAARIWRSGNRIRHSYSKARRFYLQACRLKHGKGCAMIGHFYTRGWGGVYRDCDRAKAMFKKGCQLGYKPACTMNCR